MSNWTRPRTDTAAWRRAVEIAKRLHLQVEVANTSECAARNGVLWVVDRSLSERAGSAETLEGVLSILAKYEQLRSTSSAAARPPWWRRLLGRTGPTT